VAKLALLIGNESYDDPRLASLSAPAGDVHALKTALKDPKIGGFDEVTVLINASLASALRQIGTLFTNRKRDDLVLLYFSGHGVVDREGHLFLALSESLPELLLGTAIPASFIKEVMDKSSSRRQVLILDCCHSGAFERGRKGSLAAMTEATFEVNGYGREILTSSSATQYSLDGNELYGHAANSLFTRFVIQGLRTGEAAPGKELITLEQLYHYAHDRVIQQTPGMTPQRWVDRQQGTLIIARNPNPWVQAIPPQLNALLENEDPWIREGAVRVLGNRLLRGDPTTAKGALQKLSEIRSVETHLSVQAAIDELLAATNEPSEQRQHARKQTTQAEPAQRPATDSEHAAELQGDQLEQRVSVKLDFDAKISTLAERLKALEASLMHEQEQRQWAEAERKRLESETQQLRTRYLTPPDKEVLWQAGKVFRDHTQDGTEGPQMIVIPAGTFAMGSAKTDRWRFSNEGPPHEVTFARPFALGVYAISFAEYDVFAQATGHKSPVAEKWGRDRRPVVNVSWDDASAYANWLSLQTGKPYRLPSESEWEYAARAGADSIYWWGNEIEHNRANCDGCGSKWDNQQTAPVDAFSANPFGLYQMLGNVWEWVWDCWNDRYRGAPTNGTAWIEGDCSRRVVRGGSWAMKPRHLRLTTRHWEMSDTRLNSLGFRLARRL
jgi:formylglycine-generating enzyme required for sulfatase activity